MSLLRITGTGILSLLIGIAAPAYAQNDQKGEKQDRDEQQQDHQQQAKPDSQHGQQQRQDRPQNAQQPSDRPAAQHQDHAQRQQQPNDRPPQARRPSNQQQQSNRNADAQQHARQQQLDRSAHAQQHQRSTPRPSAEQQRVQQSAWQQHGSQHWESDHRTWQQRGGYHGYRIPNERFRGYFGSNHGFRIYGLPFLVVNGYPRFQYEGYWFSPVDPWPQYWGDNWYDNDEVYVAYVDNGYYLYNRRYPTMGIAINISM